MDEAGQGNLKLRTNNFRVTNVAETKPSITAQVTSGVELHHDGNKKLETTDTGAVVTGILTATSVETGDAIVTGVSTFQGGVHMENLLTEEVNVTAGKLSDNTNIDVENGMVHLFTTTETTTSTPNIRYNSSTALNAKMSIGQSIVVTLITTAAAAAYSAEITIDGGAVTENWIGGSAPTTGGTSGVDMHSFTIIKTADATFTVIANHSTTS